MLFISGDRGRTSSVLRRGYPLPDDATSGNFAADFFLRYGELSGSSRLIAAIHIVRLVRRIPDAQGSRIRPKLNQIRAQVSPAGRPTQADSPYTGRVCGDGARRLGPVPRSQAVPIRLLTARCRAFAGALAGGAGGPTAPPAQQRRATRPLAGPAAGKVM